MDLVVRGFEPIVRVEKYTEVKTRRYKECPACGSELEEDTFYSESVDHLTREYIRYGQYIHKVEAYHCDCGYRYFKMSGE